jgi:hypothetical protein
MESIIAAIVVIGLILYAGLAIFEESMTTQAQLTESWLEMEERTEARIDTTMTPISATTTTSGAVVEVTLRNDGSTRLVDFDRWDVVLQYYSDTSYEMGWYPYVSGPLGNNQWTVKGIYTDAAAAQPEVFEPGIFNPGEELVVQLQLLPTIGMTTTNMIVIGTANGVTVPTMVNR